MSNDSLASSLSFLAKQQGRLYSPQALVANLPIKSGGLDLNNFTEAAARAGFYAEVHEETLEGISEHVLPVILVLQDGEALVLTRRHQDQFELIHPEADQSPVYESHDSLASRYSGKVIYLKDIFMDEGNQIRKYVDAISGKAGWFKRVLMRYKGIYLNVAIASLVINLLGIVSSLYVMNVYDRVIPNQAEATLLALTLGVAIAYLFDFILKGLRAYFIDVAGKKSDVILSSVIFSAVMNVRLGNRPGSSGSFANVIREFDSVRDFFTSTTLTAFVDIPFILIYIAIIFMIGGAIGYVVLAAAIMILLLNILLQIPLKRLVNEAQQEGAYKHSLLIESLSGLEQVKALRAQGVMRAKWEKVTGVLAINGMHTKLWTSIAQNTTSFIQQLTTTSLVFWGCFEVFEGNLSMGGLIACVILVGRAVAPLGQATNLASRYQSMRLSLQNVDEFMVRENESNIDKSLLSRPILRGGFEFKAVSFAYPEQTHKALDGVSLKVEPGEKVAFLGKNGSGKSTLLRLLMDYYAADDGRVLIDNVDIRQIDVADLRNNIAYVAQNANLFVGSIRDNVLLSNPALNDETFTQLLHDTNLISLVQGQEQGLDLQVGELGNRLSGGQRQMVALAAALANEGNLVLMDEPTSALDKGMELYFIARMKERLKDKTLILSTHQPSLLELVDRIVILDDGKIVADGPKAQVLKQLAENQATVQKAHPGSS